MASITMTASFLGSSTSTITKHPLPTSRRGLVVAKASRATEGEKTEMVVSSNSKEGSSINGRRELVFAAAAAAAAAACSIAKVAMADEPQRGTPEAKKKYAPVCVTMPTARICRK